MNQVEIKKLLHHRDPYLLVSNVVELDEKHIFAKADMKDHPLVAGHFPGAPIVPGAMLQEMSTQAAGILITKLHSPVENYDSEKTQGYALGVLREVFSAKYFGMTRPSSEIDIKVSLTKKKRTRFKFRSVISQAGEEKAIIEFELVNIPGNLL
ncbi:MAG: hypothetical protein VYA54_00335 [Bdellovibrionota bacterium]|nr:hypothetical protein [Bdellovibrionota bacterium]